MGWTLVIIGALLFIGLVGDVLKGKRSSSAAKGPVIFCLALAVVGGFIIAGDEHDEWVETTQQKHYEQDNKEDVDVEADVKKQIEEYYKKNPDAKPSATQTSTAGQSSSDQKEDMKPFIEFMESRYKQLNALVFPNTTIDPDVWENLIVGGDRRGAELYAEVEGLKDKNIEDSWKALLVLSGHVDSYFKGAGSTMDDIRKAQSDFESYFQQVLATQD